MPVSLHSPRWKNGSDSGQYARLTSCSLPEGVCNSRAVWLTNYDVRCAEKPLGPADIKFKRAMRITEGMTRIIYCALFLLGTVTAHGGAASDQPDPEEWLRKAEAAYDRVTSYTAVFHKQQRVAGKLYPEETILVKFKKPFSLYMKWIKAPYQG